MERCVTLIRVIPRGRGTHPASNDISSEIAKIVDSFGGTTEGIWTLGGGPYQFVSVATYPDSISASKARARIEALGIVTVEGYPVFDMPECLQEMAV